MVIITNKSVDGTSRSMLYMDGTRNTPAGGDRKQMVSVGVANKNRGRVLTISQGFDGDSQKFGSTRLLIVATSFGWSQILIDDPRLLLSFWDVEMHLRGR